MKTRPLSRRQLLAAFGGLAATAVLAACGGTPATAGTSPSTSAPAGAASGAAGVTPGAAASLQPVELSYRYYGSPPKDLKLVQDALNATLKERINATVVLTPIEPGAYDEKMKLANASGEQFDLQFTAPWVNNYYQNVAGGSLVALDELLRKHAPKLWASMPSATWDAARVQGKIYGAINQQIFVKPFGIVVRKDLAEKYKLDLGAIGTYEDLEPFLKQLKEGERDLTPIYTDERSTGLYVNEMFFYDPIVSQGITIAVKGDDPAFKATDVTTTDEYRRMLELNYRWVRAGYMSTEPPPVADAVSAFKAGKYALLVNTVVKPGGELEAKTKFGFDFVQKSLTRPMLTTGGTVATLNAVSRTSKNPERATMFLELLNTDKAFYTLMCKGIEGKHYAKVADNVIGFPPGVTAQTSGYNPNTDWMFGNQFNAFYVDATQVGNWEKTKELNDTAARSTALGFAFSFDKVKTEIAQLTAATKEASASLYRGAVAPAPGLAELQKQAKAAGVDKVLEEAQRQLGEWKQGRK